jgi:adenylosuccinate synthase
VLIEAGTTKKGIGPTYSTKMTRSGLRMCDLFDEEVFEQKLERLATSFQKRYGDLLQYDLKAEIEQYKVRLYHVTFCRDD